MVERFGTWTIWPRLFGRHKTDFRKSSSMKIRARSIWTLGRPRVPQNSCRPCMRYQRYNDYEMGCDLRLGRSNYRFVRASRGKLGTFGDGNRPSPSTRTLQARIRHEERKDHSRPPRLEF